MLFTKNLDSKIFSALSVQSLMVLISFFSLIYAFIISDFSNETVYNNSHTTKPLFYKISGAWGNHEGSLLLWLLVLTIFSACETEFNVNADWKEVTVVYGLLDQSQDKQYIRINKAFLGDEDAFIMASVADSINYHPNNLEVKIEKVSASGNVLDTKILTDTIMFKEDGLFSTDENIIYVFDTDNFLNEEKEYKLIIRNLVTGNVVSSQTKLIHANTNKLMLVLNYSKLT